MISAIYIAIGQATAAVLQAQRSDLVEMPLRVDPPKKKWITIDWLEIIILAECALWASPLVAFFIVFVILLWQ